jgi:hypothetical protein
MLLSEAETNNTDAAMVKYQYTFRGRRPYACRDVHHTEPGRSQVIPELST